MRRIAFFVEDYAHQHFLKALIDRLADKHQIPVKYDWRNVRHGHGAVIKELKQFLRDISGSVPDLIVVATDANCKGLTERTRVITEITEKTPFKTICAIPDPHIERWLLLDSNAFKEVFGRGCNSPDQKCERSRYKKMLVDAIRQSGTKPSFGGIEFIEEIVKNMDLNKTARSDDSLKKLINNLTSIFQDWSNNV